MSGIFLHIFSPGSNTNNLKINVLKAFNFSLNQLIKQYIYWCIGLYGNHYGRQKAKHQEIKGTLSVLRELIVYLGEKVYATHFFFFLYYHVEGMAIGVLMAIKKIETQTSTQEPYCLVGGIKQHINNFSDRVWNLL